MYQYTVYMSPVDKVSFKADKAFFDIRSRSFIFTINTVDKMEVERVAVFKDECIVGFVCEELKEEA